MMPNELEAPQFCDEAVQDMADSVREAHHGPRLKGARFRYLFMPKMPKRDGQITLGSAKKLSAADSLLVRADFVIRLNHEEWQGLTDDQRRALLDHELSHCGKNEKGNWSSVPHDLEEFRGVVQRHGLWKEDVEQFADTIQQRCLFDGEVAGQPE